MKPFLCVAWLKPTKKESDDGSDCAIIVPLCVVLATDDKHASMLVSRQVPEEYTNKLSRVEVAVRPF